MPVLPTSASEYTHYVGNLAGTLPDPTIKQSTFLYKQEYPSLRSVLVSKYADPSRTLLRDPVFCSIQRQPTRFIESSPIPPPPPPPSICTALSFSPAQDEFGIPYQSFLTVPNNGDFAPGGDSDFTVQWFQYMDLSLFQPFPRVFSINDTQLAFSWEIVDGTWRGVLYLKGTPYTLAVVNGSVILDKWVFVSLVRDSYTFKLFINGVNDPTMNTSGIIPLNDTSTLFIGQMASLGGVTEGYFGRITNFHFVVGTALTSVPIGVIQPIPGTKLLLDVIDFDNRFVDSGPLAKTVTSYGVGWIDSNPFV